jgi:IMP dehydrogenase/GMP reductase
VALTPTAASLGGNGHDIRVEIRRGVTAITVSWPISAAAECAAWMRDWLK